MDFSRNYPKDIHYIIYENVKDAHLSTSPITLKIIKFKNKSLIPTKEGMYIFYIITFS